ncbi:BTAD domain-containing putative transcriptional regulator [Streptomyces sp. NPDC050560]|uniref:AfsR/SARP family transcriptional regulator n=1 Tax=Streptomyces sp. NPDC050560 TaxID=3365630 RepID=UPI0037902FBF
MQFRVLGPPGIYDDVRQRSVQLTSPKQRVLLGALLVRLGSPVPTEELIRELWGDSAPDKAANALQAHVSRLRQQLIEAEPGRANSPRLVVRGSGYVLQARPDELDSVQFRFLVTRAKRLMESDPHSAGVFLRKALGLWRGPALDGGSQGPLCAAAAARLEEERLLALEDLGDTSLRLGQHRQVVRRLEELVASHPNRGRFREQLAAALQRGGRHGEARAVRDTVRRPRAAEAQESGRAGNLRVLRDPDARPGCVDLAPEPAPARAAEPGLVEGPGTQGHELVRLRSRVEELVSQQHAMRAELERLTALVEQGAPGLRSSSA